jgi:hypothetical protein
MAKRACGNARGPIRERSISLPREPDRVRRQRSSRVRPHCKGPEKGCARGRRRTVAPSRPDRAPEPRKWHRRFGEPGAPLASTSTRFRFVVCRFRMGAPSLSLRRERLGTATVSGTTKAPAPASMPNIGVSTARLQNQRNTERQRANASSGAYVRLLRDQARELVHGRPTPVDRWKGSPSGVVRKDLGRAPERAVRSLERKTCHRVSGTASALFERRAGPRGP